MTDGANDPAALPDETRWSLEKCDGYLDLRLPERARAELQNVSASYHQAAPYLRCGLRLAFEEKNWPAAVDLARALRQQSPAEADYWIQHAYAVRRVTGLEDARAILEEAQVLFPKVSVIPFNLACYACQRGRQDEARAYLKSAMEMDPHCREAALDDDDLKPLWAELG